VIIVKNVFPDRFDFWARMVHVDCDIDGVHVDCDIEGIYNEAEKQVMRLADTSNKGSIMVLASEAIRKRHFHIGLSRTSDIAAYPIHFF
jgi:hypothetical protein